MATHDHVPRNLPAVEPEHSQDTVFTEILATSFRKYHDAYQKIEPNKSLSVKLPRIVVVGMRNVGKSSLLENITKCSIFPRDSGLCTKMPIRLRLKQVGTQQERMRSVTYQGVVHQVDMEKGSAEGHKDILDIIRDIMQNTKGLGDHDIEVDISETDVPTVEIVDLPGIQNVPPKAKEETVALVDKFMRKDDRLTIVICVIPANESSFADTALSLVQKPSCTIVALTKADKVDMDDPDEVRDHLFLPLLGRHEDLQGMGGCVAVSNRKHSDRVTLEDQRVCEAALFTRMLAKATAEFVTDAIQQQLNASMGSKQLIVQLAAMYRRHVVEHWIPRAQHDAETQRAEAEKLLRECGPRPEELQEQMEATLADMQEKVNFGAMSFEMVKVVSRIMQRIPPNFVAGSSANLLEWAEHTISTKENLAQAVHHVTVKASKEYEGVACMAYDAVFNSDKQLSRFPSLQKEIKTSSIPNRVLDALTSCKPAIDVMVTNAEQQLYKGTLSQQDVVQVFQQLKHSMGRCIVEHMVKFLKHSPLSLPAGFQLIEDDAKARESMELSQRIHSLTQAINELDELKGAPSTSMSEQASHVYQAESDANNAAVAAMQQSLGSTHEQDAA